MNRRSEKASIPDSSSSRSAFSLASRILRLATARAFDALRRAGETNRDIRISTGNQRTAPEIRRKFRRRLRSPRSFRFRAETSRIRIILLARTPGTCVRVKRAAGERDGSFLRPLMETYSIRITCTALAHARSRTRPASLRSRNARARGTASYKSEQWLTMQVDFIAEIGE